MSTDAANAPKRRSHHLLIFAVTAVVTLVLGTVAFILFTTTLTYNGLEKAIRQGGLGSGSGIPVNTLYTVPALASPSTAKSNVLIDGTNRDTLYTVGWLDLSSGPQQLHVPDMAARYYSIEFVDPSDGSVFAYVGRRTTGTGAGDFLITGPESHGTVPGRGAKQISSPNNRVLVIGRVLVESDADLATARARSQQIQLTPLEH